MLRWTVALLLLLGTSCATTGVVRLETGQGAALEYKSPTSRNFVKVDEGAFEEGLARLVLAVPLSIRSSPQVWLVRASSPSNGPDTRWQHLLRKSLGGMCRPHQPKEDCLSLLDDVMGMSPTDKLVVALGLSLDPMRESIARAVEDTLTPQLFSAAIATSMVTWVILAANPEPVFTKAAAIVSAVMLVYLGVDAFLEVVKACFELRRSSEQAVTFEELEEASARFGQVMGGQGSRVFILAVTVLVSRGTMGGTSWLATRLPLLPRFAEASVVGASQAGIRLESVGEISTVAVVEGNLVITLAPTAVAMAAQGMGGGSTPDDRSFKSFDSFKRILGPAGFKKQWHHIVEQTEGNVARFGPEAIHNTKNVIPLDEALHKQVSRLYSQIRSDITGSETLTLRKWLSTQSLEEQRRFGLLAIENVQKGLWP